MIIVPTRKCNSKCLYCGVDKIDTQVFFDENLDFEVFFGKLSFLSDKTNDKKLRFFGGEPLIKKKLVFDLIRFIQKKDKSFEFIINTNAYLLSESDIDLLKTLNVKLIVSCNGGLEDQIASRGGSKELMEKLYETIKYIAKSGIDYQINVVVLPDNCQRLTENISFIYDLGVRKINLLTGLYLGWKDEELKIFSDSLEKLTVVLDSELIGLEFINSETKVNIPLFLSEIVIDSDGGIFPSMIIFEIFFKEFKQKLLISNLSGDLDKIKDDFSFWDEDFYEINEIFMQGIIQNKFGKILENDYAVNEILSNFFIEIRGKS